MTGLALADAGVVGEAGGDERGGQVAAQPRRAGRARRARRAARHDGEELAADRVEDRPRTSSQATLTHHCGIPKRKFTVPSSGSTTQRRPVVPRTSSPSSPRIPSCGRRAASTARMAASAARSASLTGSVAVDFVRTSTSPVAPKCASSTAPAGPGGLDRDLEDLVAAGRRHPTCGRRSAHGRAASSWPPRASSARVGVGRADELDGQGQAVASKPGRDRGRGVARRRSRRRGRHLRGRRVDGPERPRPCSAPMRKGGPAGPGSRSTSTRSKTRSMRAASAGSSRRTRATVRGRHEATSRAIPRVRRSRRSGCGREAASSWMPRRYRVSRLPKARRPVVDLDVADVVAERAQEVGGLLDRAALLGAEAGHRPGHEGRADADAQPARPRAHRAGEAPGRDAVGGHVEEQRGVGDRPRERPEDREAVPGVGVGGPERDPPPRAA